MRRRPNKPLIAAIGLVALSLGGTTFARPPCAQGGEIDLADAESRHAQRLARTDADGNGSISLAEFLQAPEPRGRDGGCRHRGGPPGGPGPDAPMGSRQGGVDTAAIEDSVFAELDADKDGNLSRAEFNRERLRTAHHMAMRKTIFAKLDANHDGALDADEMPNPLQRLRKLDTNGDGKVTAEERKARWKGHRPEAGSGEGDGA